MDAFSPGFCARGQFTPLSLQLSSYFMTSCIPAFNSLHFSLISSLYLFCFETTSVYGLSGR